MAEHPNVTRVRGGYDAFSKGDFAALDELFAADIRWHEPAGNQLSGDYQGRIAVYEFFGRLAAHTENSLRIDLRSVLADDETAVAIVEISARRGERSFQVTNAHIFRFEGDQVAEFWETSGDQHAVDAVFG
jgi:ketosteroid isomerase-like protein